MLMLLCNVWSSERDLKINTLYPAREFKKGEYLIFDEAHNLKFYNSDYFTKINTLSRNTTHNDFYLCECGHYEHSDDIHAVATVGGADYWGDLCSDCFSKDIPNVKESKGRMANWELVRHIPKAIITNNNFKVGDLVIVRDPKSPYHDQVFKITDRHDLTNNMIAYGLSNGTVKFPAQLEKLV